MAYELLCEHFVPACTTKVEAETKEKLAEKVEDHLRSHHGLDPLEAKLNDKMWQAIVRLRG